MKKLTAILLAAMLLTFPALAAAPEVERIEYEGNGFIEMDFLRDVSYENLSIAVRDFSGTEYPVTIFERDDDDLTFRAENLTPGGTYEITVSGIREGRTGDFGSVIGQISIPEAGLPAVRSIEYDAGDRELDIEFVENVDFSGLQLEVIDQNGNAFETRIIENDRDSFEAKIDGLTRGESYLAKISGVSLSGQNDFRTITAEFIARDD